MRAGRIPRRWLIAALAAAAVLAACLAAVSYHHRIGRADREAQTRFHVQAMLLTGSDRPPSYHEGDTDTHRRVAARWQAPRGSVHDGLVLVPAGLRAGDLHPVWVTHDGRKVPAPASSWAIARHTALTGVIYFGGLSIIFVSAIPAWRVRLAARNLDAGWSQVEPIWRRRHL